MLVASVVIKSISTALHQQETEALHIYPTILHTQLWNQLQESAMKIASIVLSVFNVEDNRANKACSR